MPAAKPSTANAESKIPCGCPFCSESVAKQQIPENWAFCPLCGSRLRGKCPKCGCYTTEAFALFCERCRLPFDAALLWIWHQASQGAGLGRPR